MLNTPGSQNHGILLQLSTQRALTGNLPASLRSVSVEQRGTIIFFRAVFDPGASENDRELLSIAATEIIADFSAPITIHEEYLEIASPTELQHLEHLVFLRAEPENAEDVGKS